MLFRPIKCNAAYLDGIYVKADQQQKSHLQICIY